jgi:hypothetical protein
LALGYLACLALVGRYLSELAFLSTEAAPTGSIRWRYGFTGITFVSMKWLLVAFGASLVSAVMLKHRGVLKVLSVVGWSAVVLTGAALVIYALDFLQLRLSVSDAAQRKFTTISMRSGVVALAAISVAGMMASAAWRVGTRNSRPGLRRRD